MEEHIRQIHDWAEKGLRCGEIDEEMYNFVTNVGKTDKIHLANSKPQPKTHKVDESGNIPDPCPERIMTVGTNTLVHAMSKLISKGIEHLASKESLPNMTESTQAVVKIIFFMKENFEPLRPEAKLAFSDIKNMYPSVARDEGVNIVERELEKNPSPLGMSARYLAEGLKLCLELNCIQFKGKFYQPCKVCAQGRCPACTFTDMWVGDIVKKHIETNQIDSVLFSIYRDDGWNVLNRSELDEENYKNHMNSLHENIQWDINVASEGGYLDLWIMIKDGEIQWKTYTKTPPLFLQRSSCHDPMVFKGITNGLRLTNSTKEGFEETVEEYSRALATSGYKYKQVKKYLMKYEKLNVKDLASAKKNKKNNPKLLVPSCSGFSPMTLGSPILET